MKNIFKISALAVLAVGLLASCQMKELDASLDQPVREGRSFTVTFADPATKVAVTDAGKSTWEVGDQILIHGAGETNKEIVTLAAGDISADGKKATITITSVEPYDRSSDRGYTSTYYAQYPASASIEGGNYYYYSEFAKTNNILMAGYNDGDVFVMYNLCGLITFTVDANVNSYTFEGNNGEVVGYEKLISRLAGKGDEDPVLEWKYSSTSGELTSIDGEITSGKTAYVCLPLGTDFSAGFKLTLKKNGRPLYTATTEKAVNVGRNQILPLGDLTAKLVEVEAPATCDHTSAIALDGAVDLSAEGSANSYIITAPGTYKLPAVKGNSSEALPVLFDAEILWESYSNTEEVVANSVIEAIDFQGDWVVFKTPETLKPGNALIAAENYKGEVLWSWHIWVPATAITTDTYGLSSSKMMDRNLGALLPATTDAKITGEMFGLAYQWGRKDPFVSAGSLDVTTPATVAGVERTKNDGTMTLEQSIANPTVFAATDGKFWESGESTTLWGEEKTIYDPCPPGYKVPATSEVSLFSATSVDEITGWSYDVETSHTFTAGDPVTVFPIGGYLNYNNKYDKPGLRVKIYHATAPDSYAPAIYLYDNSGSPKYSAAAGQRRAVGGNIRCISTVSTPSYLKYEWRTEADTTVTVAYNEAGAYHWYIDADADVEFEASVTLNGEATTAGVTIEKYETSGGHIAINYAANTDPADQVWEITVTSTSNVENPTLKATLTQGGYEYSNLKEFNEAIIASGTKSVDRILNISADAKLYVTKKSGKYVYAQSAHDYFTGGVLFYGTGLENSVAECNTISGKVVATTTTYNGVPEVTKITYNSEDVSFGYDGNTWPCEKPTIKTLKESYNLYVNTKIELNNNYSGVTVSDGFSTSDRSGTIKDSTGEIALYVQLTDGTITGHIAGTVLNKIIVWPTYYKTTQQVGLWSQPSDVKSIPSTITIPAAKSIEVGGSFDLGATTNSTATITYASSDETVATVSEAGLVEAVAKGEATITASVEADGKYTAATATCVVTVLGEGETPVTHKFVKVTATEDITDGDYLIVYETTGVAFNGALTTLDAVGDTISVTIVGSEIEATDENLKAVFTLDVTTGTILSKSGYYINCGGLSTYSNGLKQTASLNDQSKDHSFTIDASGNAIISQERPNGDATGHMILNYNANSGNYRFRYYKEGSQKAVQLYKYE